MVDGSAVVSTNGRKQLFFVDVSVNSLLLLQSVATVCSTAQRVGSASPTSIDVTESANAPTERMRCSASETTRIFLRQNFQSTNFVFQEKTRGAEVHLPIRHATYPDGSGMNWMVRFPASSISPCELSSVTDDLSAATDPMRRTVRWESAPAARLDRQCLISALPRSSRL